MSNRWYYIAGIILLLGIGSIVLMTLIIPPQPDPSPASQTDKLAEILARGRIVIATDSAYPPNSDLVPGASRTAGTKCAPTEYTANQVTGYNVAVAEEIARQLGVEPCFVMPTRTQIISGSWAEGWDIHVGSLTITSDRMKALYFTQPYYAGPVVMFVHKNNSAFSEISDLSGKRVGVCAGCILERYLQGTLELPGQTIDFAVKNASIVAYDNEANALSDLAAGDGVKLDAVLTNLPMGQDAIKNGIPIRPLNKPAFYGYVAAAVDKKSSRDPASFVNTVTGIIRQQHSDGTLQKLSQQYYGQDRSTEAGKFNISALGQFPP
ncbi:MAG: transporter substrate-binding domain-containing protein [Methanoregula sp.]